jgi:hypothetical protein
MSKAGAGVGPAPPEAPVPAKAPKAPKPRVTIKLKKKSILTAKDIEQRKNANIEVIKARVSERERYNRDREKRKELGIIEKARLKRINPTAFASQNAPVFDMTGQKAQDTPEELDEKQRKETIRALGKPAQSAQPQNFVVEKPLKPNALDIYQAQKIQQRDTVRNQKAFAPVQKL